MGMLILTNSPNTDPPNVANKIKAMARDLHWNRDPKILLMWTRLGPVKRLGLERHTGFRGSMCLHLREYTLRCSTILYQHAIKELECSNSTCTCVTKCR